MHQNAERPRDSLTQKSLAIRKEQLLDRAILERAQLTQARADISTKFGHLNTFRRLLLRWPTQPASWAGKYLGQRPLLGLLFSALLATPARNLLLGKVKRSKSLLRWSILGLALWQGMRLLRPFKARRPNPK